MKSNRVGRFLAGLAFAMGAPLGHAESAGASAAPSTSAQVAPIDGKATGSTLRASPERVRKMHRETTRVPAAMAATPVAYPAAPASAGLRGENNGAMKGWVLLLMGAFLICTIFQRRYQALSDI